MNGQVDITQFFRPSGIPYALGVLAATIVLAHLITRNFERLGERMPGRRLTFSQVGTFARFALYLAGASGAVLSVVNLSRDLVLAIGGTAAVSLGFGLKDYVASVFAGLVILVDRPFQVGDRVTFDGYYGEIRHIGLRSVKLVTLDDTQVTIPNNRFLTDSVASGNAGNLEMMLQMDFHVAVDQDVALAKRIVEEALTSSRYICLRLPWIVVVSEVMNESFAAVRLRARGYVADVKFEAQFVTDVSERVLEAFRREGVKAPLAPRRSE